MYLLCTFPITKLFLEYKEIYELVDLKKLYLRNGSFCFGSRDDFYVKKNNLTYSHPTIAEHPQLRNTLVQFRKYLSFMNFSDDESIFVI